MPSKPTRKVGHPKKQGKLEPISIRTQSATEVTYIIFYLTPEERRDVLIDAATKKREAKQ